MAITRAISTMVVDVQVLALLLLPPPPLYSQPFVAVVVIIPYNKIQFSVKMDSYFIFYLFPFFLSLRFVIAAAVADVAAFSGPFAFFCCFVQADVHFGFFFFLEFVLVDDSFYTV